jgi:hypothetical protein
MVFIFLMLGLAGLGCSSGGTGTPDAALDDGVGSGGDPDSGEDRGPDVAGDPGLSDRDDGGLEDAADGGSTDGGGDLPGDGSIPGDIDLGDDFGLFIPAGAGACTHTGISPADLPAAFAGKARVTFKPGVTRLF